MRYQTIIWDLDGTLLDTLDDLRASANRALAASGYPEKSKEEIRAAVGNGIRVLIERILPDGAGNPDFEKVLADFKTDYADHCEDATRPYDGVMSLLRECKTAGIRMAIVSNKADFAVKRLAEKYFDGCIEVAIGENEAAGIRKKPAPDTVYQALRRLGVTAQSAVYIGDSEVDVATAKNAQLPCISVTWGFRSAAQLKQSGADTFLRTPQELRDYLLRG